MTTGDRIRDAAETIVKTNPPFKITGEIIWGVKYHFFKNVPTAIPALLKACRETQNSHIDDYLAFQKERWSYNDICSEIASAACILKENFYKKHGTPVTLAMRNVPEMLILMMGIAADGGVVIFLNAWWTHEELAYALDDSVSKIIFADGARSKRLVHLKRDKGLTVIGVRDGEDTVKLAYSMLFKKMGQKGWPEHGLQSDDEFAIMYSSSTTGQPKGVIQTHRGAISAVFSWLKQGAITDMLMPQGAGTTEIHHRHLILIATALFHVTATRHIFLFSLAAGAKLCPMKKWDAEEAVKIIEEECVTRFFGVPTQSADLMVAKKRMQASLSSLEFLAAGGAKRPPAQVNELKTSFPHTDIATGWGITETSACRFGFFGKDYLENPDAAGRLNPTLQHLQILDDDGNALQAVHIEEIALKNACNVRSYLNKPDTTAEVFQDGWLKTGDLGIFDKDGLITIFDRKKNIVIRGGENIACLDVEGALHRHPAVAESCAFSIPNARLGEVAGAAVQSRPGMNTTQSDIKAFLNDHIAHFKIPEHLWIKNDPLPRGATDKLDRRGLSDICLAELPITTCTIG